MKKLALFIVSVLFTLSMVFLTNDSISSSGNCILCQGGGQCACIDSNCSQKDTQDCKKLGCERSGTSSCSTAANVKKYR